MIDNLKQDFDYSSVNILAHGVDPDGIISHSLLERYHYRSDIDIKHQFLDYPNLYSALKNMSKDSTIEDSLIYVADLGIDRDVRDSPEMLMAIRERNHLIWIDHHDGSFENKDLLDRVCSKNYLYNGVCSSKIINDIYLSGKGDNYSTFLADMAQSHDFEQFKRSTYTTAVDLQDLISFRNLSPEKDILLNSLVKDIVLNSAWNSDQKLNPNLMSEVKEFRDMKKATYDDLLASITEHEVDDKKIIIGYADNLLYMKPAPDFLRSNLDAHFYITIFNNKPGSVMIYGHKSKMDRGFVPKICQSFGGGGRGHGGGFTLGEEVSIDSYESNKDKVLSSLIEFLEQDDGSSFV